MANEKTVRVHDGYNGRGTNGKVETFKSTVPPGAVRPKPAPVPEKTK
jgi:hypothetical protein